MIGTKKYYEVDSERFDAELKKVKHTRASLSKEMGYNPFYIGKQLSRYGGLAKTVINYLDRVYNIPLEHYEKKEEKPVQTELPKAEQKVTQEPSNSENTTIRIADESIQQLAEVIYKSVYEAVKKAWSE
ncbi:MAG: hypothetical protein Q4B26_11095 [Eubacteriales bacterium]|nr:hypothetical protein [Eubacteriales bacterium]